jgi:hypothetical protein
MKAKDTSLWGQVFSAVWVVGWSAYMFIAIPESLTMTSIIGTAIATPAMFSPVFVSIILDKIKEIKIGKVE